MEIRINEAFRDYKPPFDATKVVRKLLTVVPERYFRELDCIVLTNESALSRKERVGTIKSRKRKVQISRVRGLYHHAWHGKPAWIEIRLDKTLSLIPKMLTWVPLFRELSIGEVLYHELGHHIHSCVRPEYKEKEDVADDWGIKLSGQFVWTHYRWLTRIVAFTRKIRKLIAAKEPAIEERKARHN
jgi:hypothetical protein